MELLEKQYGSSSKKLEVKLSYDPETLLLSISPKALRTGSHRDVCTSCSVTPNSLRWKQPRCLLMDTWMSNMWSIPPINTLSHKEGGNSDTCHNISEPEDIMLSEIRQSQKGKYYMNSRMQSLDA